MTPTGAVPCRVRQKQTLATSNMADVAGNRMNLAAVQRSDPFITDIVDTASQVALYTFSAKANEWVSLRSVKPRNLPESRQCTSLFCSAD